MALNQFEPIYFTPAPVRGRYLSGLWKSSGSTPAAPDPVATANAQGAANLDAAKATTALSHADQITPYGTLKWTQGGTGQSFDQTGYDSALKQYQTDMDSWNQKQKQKQTTGSTEYSPDFFKGNTVGQEKDNTRPVEVSRDKFNTNYDPLKWTSTIALDPKVQQALDTQLKQTNDLAGATNTALDRVTSTLAKDPTSNLPVAATSAGSQAYAAGQFTDSKADIARSQALAAQGGALASSQIGKLQDLYKTDLNYNSATAMPGADETARKKIEDSLYANSTSRLGPQYQQGQSDLDARLATQGITQGSDAWKRENSNMSMAKNDAYANARNSAVTGSTDQMQKLFQMGLASRQQGVTEANTIRNQTSTEAALAASLNSGLAADNRGYYGVEQGQKTAASQIAAQDYAMDSADRATANTEQTAQRQQVLNELNALRTGSQVSMPQFQSNTGGAQVGAAPIAQSIYNGYQGDIAANNASVSSSNSATSGIVGLAMAAATAY